LISQGRILVVDDEAEVRESLEALLTLEGFGVGLAATAAEAVRLVESRPFDVVLLDVALPDKPGLAALEEIRRLDPNLPVVMITAYASVESAVAAMRAGARNYLTKPWDNEKLVAELRNSVVAHRLQAENVQLKRALKERYSFENIVGKSERMLKIFDLVEQVAPSRSTVLVAGESGTGKELIAKAIHAHSPRADRPFVPVNTGSMPIDLLESLLFGHVRGAFTSAVASKKGFFEVADQGTLFFDEIATVGLETQAKLLRVIQEREFTPLGSTEQVRVDVRLVAATNVDLRKLVAEGKFREDLYYRLNVISLHLPPLRERKEDIPLLAEHFLRKYCDENQKPLRRLAPEAMRLLMDYNWPGNVRELENVVERAVVLSRETVVDVALLPEPLLEQPARGSRPFSFLETRPDASLFEIMDECERRVITDMLEKTGGSQTEAAERFQVPLSTLNQKIKRLNIEIKRKSRNHSNGTRDRDGLAAAERAQART
jgi:DNA-binding NtrC family response regulator